MPRTRNIQNTPPAVTPATPETPKTRERRSEVERTALAVEKAIDAFDLVGSRVKSWLDASRDEDARTAFQAIHNAISTARDALKGKATDGSEIAKMIRDHAPKSARMTDYEPGDFVKIRTKYRAGFLDAVDGNASSLDDLVVFSVKPAMIGLRSPAGDKFFVMRTQIHPADVSEDAPVDGTDDDETEATNDEKVA